LLHAANQSLRHQMNTNSDLIVLEEVDSTNRFAQELLQNAIKVNEGTAILSFYQTSGKGQKGNVWESEPGSNMLASVILFPDFLEPSKLNLINQAVALSVCTALTNHSGYQFKIKWPNDIIFGEKKIAGILIENSIREKRCTHSIVGVGINLNQEAFKAYQPKAISLKKITKKTIDSIPEFTTKWRNVLIEFFEMIRNGEEKKIVESYSQLLFGLGEIREFEYDGIRTNGIIRGVTEEGYLQIQTDTETREFGIKEVKYIFEG
jgi:BirA family biotin operon repressor/biotin-[acetyl-CoA-carboxylase] ligase